MSNTPFYYAKKNHRYSKPIDVNKVEADTALYLPLVIDTEYVTRSYPYSGKYGGVDFTLTVQVKGIETMPQIFLHKEAFGAARQDLNKLTINIPLFTSEFVVIEYLRELNIISETVKPHPCNQYIYIDIYGHFLVADCYRIVNGTVKDRFLEATANKNEDDGCLLMERRLKAFTKVSPKRRIPYIALPIALRLFENDYNVMVGFTDTCAIQGAISLQNFLDNVGISVTNKKIVKESEKSNMLEVLINDPSRFIKYATSDLLVYKALLNQENLIKDIYNKLGLSKLYKRTGLTIGTTVAELFTAALQNELGINKRAMNAHLNKGSTANLLGNKNRTSIYLSKTSGGRCFNNKPLHTASRGIFVRVDIKSCYGNSLQAQEYPVGLPVIIEYNKSAKNNQYMSLRQTLSLIRDDLVDGLWYFRVSTDPGYLLEHKNDWFMSWYPSKDMSNFGKTDTDYEDFDNLYKQESTKHHSREVHLAPFTYADLEWLEHVCKPIQRNEYLDRLKVIAGVYYPKSTRVDNFSDYEEKVNVHGAVNTWDVKYNNTQLEVCTTSRENHTWFSLNIDKLILGRLMHLRGQYPKDDPQTRAMNKLIKLLINTVYGVLVSPKFPISKYVVGNNVTARARAMAWYLEKTLDSTQTITDSVTIDIQKIVHAKNERKVSAVSLYDIEHSRKSRIISLKPLGGINYKARLVHDTNSGKLSFIELDNATISKMINEHLRKTLPDLKIIKLFDVEVEDIFTELATLGKANFQTRNPNNDTNIKMRGHKNQDYIIPSGNKMVNYNPVRNLFEAINEKPSEIPRIKPVVASQILKTKQYQHNLDKYSRNYIYPGQTIQSIKKIRELSISQFQFESEAQESSWKREEAQLYKKYNQGYEMFFMKGEKLDIQRAIFVIGMAIQAGKRSYRATLTKSEKASIHRKYCEDPRTNDVNELQSNINETLYNL